MKISIFLALLTFSLNVFSDANDFVDFSYNQTKERTGVSWDIENDQYFIKNIVIENNDNVIKEVSPTEKSELFFSNGKITTDNILVKYTGCAAENICQEEKIFEIDNQYGDDSNKRSSFYKNDFVGNTKSYIEDPRSALAILENKTTLFSLLAFFLLGILMAFTPCIFPMLPIISSIVVNNKRKPLLVSTSYGIGIACAYAFIGLIMGIMNINIQIYLQNSLLLTITSLIFFLLALFMLIDFKWSIFNKSNNFFQKYSERIQPNNLYSVFSMGFLSALIISPCAAAPILGVILFIQIEGGQLWEQATILFSLGLGASLPLIIMATSFKRFMPKSGAWMQEIKNIFAVILMFVGVYVLEKIVFFDLFFVYLVISFIYVFQLTYKKKWKWAHFLFVLLSFFTALFYQHPDLKEEKVVSTPEIEYKSVTSLEELEKVKAVAEKEKSPVFINIYADWCISCERMGRTTFSSPEVVRYLNENYKSIKVDITDINSKKQAVLNQYKLQTAPAYIFYDKFGNFSKEYFIGYVEKERFLDTLKKQND